MEHSIYNIVIRNSDGNITDTKDGIGRTDAVELMRSLLRAMDYDEVTVQIHKRIPA